MKQLLSYMMLCLALMSIGCDDVIIPDISNECPVLVVPADSLESTQLSHTFVWDGVELSDEQRLTIYRKVNGEIATQVLDTFIIDTRFTHTFLEQGEYDWEVASLNEAYQSQIKFRTIFITDSVVAIDVSNEIINLSAPADQTCTNLTNINFSWEDNPNTNQYEFQLGNEDFSNLIVSEILNTSNIVLDTPVDGQYQWRVRGIDTSSGSQSDWSVRELSIDKTAPAAPILLGPALGDTLDQNVGNDFFWSDDIEELSYQFFLYADQNQDTLVFQQTLPSNIFNTNGSGIILNTNADYFWRVTATDKAGNVSDQGAINRFIVR